MSNILVASGVSQGNGPKSKGALIAVKLATIGKDGEIGRFVNITGQIAW